jgi:hypothetical protein
MLRLIARVKKSSSHRHRKLSSTEHHGSASRTLSSHAKNLEAIQNILPEAFVQKYSNIPPPFGFNGLGELVYIRTYSRNMLNGENRKEKWFETIARVVNGTYRVGIDR